MQKLTVTLQLSDEEVDTLGHAVEVALKYYIKEQSEGNKKFIFNDDLNDLRAIMYGLTNCGYHLWMQADNRVSFPRGRLTVDVDAWIAHEKKLLKVRDSK